MSHRSSFRPTTTRRKSKEGNSRKNGQQCSLLPITLNQKKNAAHQQHGTRTRKTRSQNHSTANNQINMCMYIYIYIYTCVLSTSVEYCNPRCHIPQLPQALEHWALPRATSACTSVPQGVRCAPVVKTLFHLILHHRSLRPQRHPPQGCRQRCLLTGHSLNSTIHSSPPDAPEVSPNEKTATSPNACLSIEPVRDQLTIRVQLINARSVTTVQALCQYVRASKMLHARYVSHKGCRYWCNLHLPL